MTITFLSNGLTTVILFPYKGKEIWRYRQISINSAISSTKSTLILCTVRDWMSNVFLHFMNFHNYSIFFRLFLCIGTNTKAEFQQIIVFLSQIYPYYTKRAVQRPPCAFLWQPLILPTVARTVKGEFPELSLYYCVSFLALYSLYISSTASRVLATTSPPLGKQ